MWLKIFQQITDHKDSVSKQLQIRRALGIRFCEGLSSAGIPLTPTVFIESLPYNSHWHKFFVTTDSSSDKQRFKLISLVRFLCH